MSAMDLAIGAPCLDRPRAAAEPSGAARRRLDPPGNRLRRGPPAVWAAVAALWAFSVAAAADPAGMAEPKPLAQHGAGRLWQVGEQRLMRLAGSAYEMGVQHGKMLPREVRECVQLFLDEYAIGQRGQTRETFAAIWKQAEPHIPARYLDELRGMADGSGVPLEDLHLVHAIPEKFHCSGAAAFGKATQDGKLYHTRSLDYALNIGRDKTVQENALVIVYVPDDGVAHAVVGWAGFAGCVSGMNARGISVGEMGSHSEGERYDGVPMSFMLREVLRAAGTLAEAIDVPRRLRRTCGYNFIFADGRAPAAAALEVNADRVQVFPAGGEAENVPPHFAIDCCVRRVNHFVDRDLAALQRKVYDPRRSELFSWLGYEMISDYLRERHGKLDAEAMIGLLRRYPPAHPCLHQAVFAPTDGEFYVSAAKSSRTLNPGAQNQTFYRYRLAAIVAGAPVASELYPPAGDGGDRGKGTAPVEKGVARADPAFRARPEAPPGKEAEFLARFDRLGEAFPWELGTARASGWGYRVQRLTFPSAAPGPHEANNTVHGDYYRPDGDGRRPAVVVLDILDGSGRVAGLVCDHLAKRGVAALTIRMAYYGERAPSPEERESAFDRPDRLVDAMVQNVVDAGRAAVWLRQRPEVDAGRVGLCGVSFGGIVGAVAVGAYRSFPRTALVLTGGDVAEVLWNAKETRRVRAKLEAQGYTVERLAREVAGIEPLAYAGRVQRGTVLMINGNRDEIVPPRSARRLWEALGRPAIRWYDASHYGLGLHVFDVLQRVADAFAEPTWGPIPATEEGPAPK